MSRVPSNECRVRNACEKCDSTEPFAKKTCAEKAILKYPVMSLVNLSYSAWYVSGGGKDFTNGIICQFNTKDLEELTKTKLVVLFFTIKAHFRHFNVRNFHDWVTKLLRNGKMSAEI